MSAIDVSSRLPAPMYAALGVLYVCGLCMLIVPDRMWWIQRPFVAWQYRDGHRLELSTAGRLWTRFGGGVTVALAVGLGLAGINWSADSRIEVERGGSVTVYYLGEPVDSPGCTVRVVICLRSEEVFPVELTGYDAFRSVEDGPGYLRDFASLSASTNLLLFVDGQFFPTHLVVSEGADRVAVSLYGKCQPNHSWEEAYGDSASDCGSASRLSLFSRDIVPVTLDSGPLGDRELVDDRGTPIPDAGG